MSIDSFQGQYRFLSNYEDSPIIFDRITYPTVEHAYQAAKTLDDQERNYIACLEKPGQARRAGQKVKIRPDWESIKIEVMTNLIRQKFFKYNHLKRLLLDTGEEELIEENNWNDRFWGVCKGSGRNELGKILMEVRSDLKLEIDN